MAGASSGGAGQGGGISDSLTGWFDLQFLTTTDPTSPSKSVPARLDLRQMGDTFTATFRPRFGTPSLLAGAIDGSSLVLTAEGDGVEVSSLKFGAIPTGPPTSIGQPCCGVVDHWKTLRLGLTPAGALDGTLSATGYSVKFSDDTTSSTPKVDATGTVKVDATAPQLAAEFSSLYDPPSSVLPWDPVVIHASESLKPPPSLTSVFTVTQNTDPAPLTFSSLFTPALGGGEQDAQIFLNVWDLPTCLLTVSAPAGLKDPSGHASLAFSATTPMLGVPPAQPSYVFENFSMVATWGDVLFLDAQAGLCESGGCARLLSQETLCNQVLAGVAGRLQTQGKGLVSVRYRVFSEGPFNPHGLTLHLVGHNGNVLDHLLTGQNGDISPLATSVEGFTHASPWVTFTGILPAGSDEVGFVVTGLLPPGCGEGKRSLALVESLETL